MKDAFYFIADIPGKSLTLKYHGANLTSWSIQKTEIVTARVLFSRRQSQTFPAIFYIADAGIQPPVDLPRPKIIPANPDEDAKDSPSALLPTMEELIKAPQDYYFAGDSPIRVQIHMPDLPKNGLPQPKFSQNFKNRIADFFKGLRGDVTPTLILTLSNPDGEKIYRAFPEKVNVLVYLKSPTSESQ